MQKISYKSKAMLACMALLVVVMAALLVRAATTLVVVKKLHIDNAMTRTILFDLPFVYDMYAVPNVAVPWDELYPFATPDKNLYIRLMDRVKAIESKIKNIEDEKIAKWTSERIPFSWPLIEMGRSYDNLIGWNILDPAKNVYRLQQGDLTFINHRNDDLTDYVTAVTDLRDFAEANGAKFMFVQGLFKVNKYGDADANGILDFTNQNADAMLFGLTAAGVNVFDLRQAMGVGLTNDEYHALFFHTDHHWRPQTALKSADLLGARLTELGITVDGSHWSLADYEEQVLENAFLGSQGKRVTLANTVADDISIYHAKFPTQVHLRIASRGIDETGDFDIFYDKSAIKTDDIYNRNLYAAYAYGDVAVLRADNLLLRDLPEQKVLIIKNSIVDSLTPFLAMGIKQLITIDLRHFTGSLRSFIAQERPDVVLIMYAPSYGEHLNPKSHTDLNMLFDFR